MSVVGSRRLQIFVSSTYLDLQDERQAAVEAILQLGHIPAGMELFAADNRAQMEVIKEWIDESDVYMLIQGGRYGTINSETGKSYTHLEWEYAQFRSKPSFACRLEDNYVAEKALKLEISGKGRGSEVKDAVESEKFAKWKSEIASTLVKPISEVKDVKIAVLSCLPVLERRYGDELSGWVRPSGVDLAKISSELAEMSAQNNALRLENTQLQERAKPLIRTFETLAAELSRSAGFTIVMSQSEDFLWGSYLTDETKEVLNQMSFYDLMQPGTDGRGYRVFTWSELGKKFVLWYEGL